MTDLHEYDPALAEAVGEGGGADEIAVIVRLSADWVLPDAVRMVSRFGDIATVRAPRERLADIATCDSVLALEASRPLRLVDAPPAAPGDDAAGPYLRRPPGVIGTGRGVVVAVLDWGIDLGHPAFRHDDGSTRFLAFWDQHGRPGTATATRWGYGRIYYADEIDRALQEPDPYRALGYHPADADERDPESGEWKGAHGTHVLDIAAGNGRGGTMPGVVPEAHLVGVHLARTARVLGRANLGDSATVLEALDFAFAVAGDRPCAVNMSIGAHGGPHDGTTLVEQGIDRAISLRPGRAVILSAGNYAAAQAHARGRVQFGRDEVLRFTVPAEDPTGSELELYYASADRFTVLLVDPSHSVVARVASGTDGPIMSGDAVVGHIYHIERGANVDRHVDVFLNPGAPAGVWQVRLRGEIIQDGRYHAWIERDRGLRPKFDRPNVDNGSTTGTLCNGRFAITVGAYDPHRAYRPIAPFSSAGPTRDGRVKPEIVAPGVRIVAARSAPRSEAPAANYTSKDGTSMAAPHVTGTVALMFEAAPALMEVEDTRALLFGTAGCPWLGEHTSVSDRHRLGYGYLDTAAAERAAATWGHAVAPDDARGGVMYIEDVETGDSIDLAEPRSTRDEETITVDDIAVEMDGLRCQFLLDYTATRTDGTRRTFSKDSVHLIQTWNGTADHALIGGFPVRKVVLAPKPGRAAAVRRYDVPLVAQRTAVVRNLRALSQWVAKESSYTSSHATWEREKQRLERALARRRLIYNRLWIRQMMYNRFDVNIAAWTQHYNAALRPSTNLDPNVVKSLLYQESRMGTSGRHLMPPPYSWSSGTRHPVRSRFNIGQAIDSWGPQQWLMMREMAPALFRRHGLDALETNRRWFGMSNSQYAAHPTFMTALRQFFQHRDGGRNLMGSAGRDLHEDYEFWIRTAIRWLFTKFLRLSTPSWREAVRSYNGSGPAARRYRDEVMARVGSTEPYTEDLREPEARPEELVVPVVAGRESNSTDGSDAYPDANGRRAAAQRVRLDLPAGGAVGDPPATNHREAVMLMLNRMHVLWAIDNTAYDRVYSAVSRLAPGAAVTDPGVLATVRGALHRLAEPSLAAPVAAAQFNLPISAGVGRGQPNSRADLAKVQDLLHTNWHLTNEAYNREHSAVTSGTRLTAVTLRETFAGISKLKRAFVAGTGKPGWSPLIHADEAGPPGPGGSDRLADRTFSFGEFLIFVPAGATASLVNKVHVFFSAGGVLGAQSHVEHHGLRGAAESHDWILVGVQGAPGQRFTVSESQVRDGLESVGRPARIDSVRMSAHSRGNGSMAETLRQRLFAASLIDHITVLDGSDFFASLSAGFRQTGVPASRVDADFVTTGAFPRSGVVRASHGMDPAGVRAFGYARLINDAVTTGRVGTPPAAISAKLTALSLPPRGTFSAMSPPPAGKINFNAFLRDPANRAALAALRTGERGVANVGQLAGSEDTSPYAFVEWHNLLNINDETVPRDQWRSVPAGIYSHHLFVAEIADDLFR